MEEYKQVIGVAIVSLTFLSILISLIGVCQRIKGVVNSATREVCDFQFKLLMLSGILLMVGGIGFYTAIRTWVQNPIYIFTETIWWRLGMSVLMFVLSVSVTMLGSRNNLFRKE